MSDLENKKFEESWRKAFSDAEQEPSEKVWGGINAELSQAETGAMKRTVFFYQRLAAASVIFALAVGGFGVWYANKEDGKELATAQQKVGEKKAIEKRETYVNAKEAQQKVDTKNNAEGLTKEDDVKNTLVDDVKERANSTIAQFNTVKNNRSDSDKVGKNELTKMNDAIVIANVNKSKERTERNDNSDRLVGKNELGDVVTKTSDIAAVANSNKNKGGTERNDNRDELVSKNEFGNDEGGITKMDEATFTALVANADKNKERTERNIFLASATWPQVEPKLTSEMEVEKMMRYAKAANAKVDVKKKKDEDKDNKENWWAGIGGSAGSYNSQGGGVTTVAPTSALTFNSNAPNSTSSAESNRAASGSSYSYGMTFGKKIASRWVILSGVNYLNQSIAYNSNIAVVDASNQQKAFVADYSNQPLSIASTTPYEINSVNEFISIPLQGGYLLMDRKVGLQLNAGVASDIFYKNTLIDQSGRLPNYSENAGTNSSYQTFNWSGLVGTELSYKMAKHYRVSLVPGLRYSFNSVLKSSAGSSLSPMVWDVGFRFRYIF
jgi:hypothetical protein